MMQTWGRDFGAKVMEIYVNQKETIVSNDCPLESQPHSRNVPRLLRNEHAAPWDSQTPTQGVSKCPHPTLF
jgi:hypothetical protein